MKSTFEQTSSIWKAVGRGVWVGLRVAVVVVGMRAFARLGWELALVCGGLVLMMEVWTIAGMLARGGR